ncbi:MAG: hypothetical protein RL032_725 [Pseudomonadota bacterium]
MVAPARNRCSKKTSKLPPTVEVQKSSTSGFQPASTGQLAGSADVNFATFVAHKSACCKGCTDLAEQLFQRLARLWCAHKRLTHQKRIHARSAHTQHVFAGDDAALCHQQPVSRHPGFERQRGLQ